MTAAARRAAPAVTPLAPVVLTAAVSLAAVPWLPERVAVGWHLGLDGSVSVTHAPRPVVLVAPPALSALLYAAVRAASRIAPFEEGRTRLSFDVAAHLLVGAPCALQAGLVLANLWLPGERGSGAVGSENAPAVTAAPQTTRP